MNPRGSLSTAAAFVSIGVCLCFFVSAQDASLHGISSVNAVKYQDLTFGQRMRLGANFLYDPNSVWNVDIGYKHVVTKSNRDRFCELASRGRGYIGVSIQGAYWVPMLTAEMLMLCQEQSDNSLVFIDRSGGEPVISWEPREVVSVEQK